MRSWLSPAWLKVLRQEDLAVGVFQREQALKQLSLQITKLQSTQKEFEQEMAERQEKIKNLESERDQLQQTYNQYQTQSAQVNAQQKAREERLLEVQSQSDNFLKEQEECIHEIKKTPTITKQTRKCRAKERSRS